MVAYVVIDRLEVIDRQRFHGYPGPARASVERYGGRYIMPAGTQIEALEGNWRPNRIVLIEFDDAEQARQWWQSAEYAEARTLHHAATISNVILIEDGSNPINRDAERDQA